MFKSVYSNVPNKRKKQQQQIITARKHRLAIQQLCPLSLLDSLRPCTEADVFGNQAAVLTIRFREFTPETKHMHLEIFFMKLK